MFADWFVPFALIIGTAMTIGLLFLPARRNNQDHYDHHTCGCYGCRQEWADEQTPQSRQVEQ